MRSFIQHIKSLYLKNRLFALLLGNVLVFIAGYFLPLLFIIAQYVLAGIIALVIVDIVLLFRSGTRTIVASRNVPEKLSNGDQNRILVFLKSFYPMPVQVKIIDEIPAQFQMRDFKITALLKPGEEKQFEYFLLPLERGVYTFGKLNIFVTGKIGLVSRRFVFDKDVSVPVYPSFMQMRKYEMLAISDKLTDSGVKKIRKVGHQMEFDQIREHVTGDDYRTVNWKATARKAKLMVNQYMDEKSQQVYSVIDMGRVMKMPFDGLSLLDYAINSTLVLSNIALMKQDKAGLITFSKDIHTVMPPVRDKIQVLKFLEVLYNQKTDFSEPDYEKLYILIKRKISQRSLILLYTNFESYVSLERHIEYLKLISRKHVLVVVFFRNTEIRNLQYTRADSVENIYINTIAEKADFEKRMIVKELMKHGIFSILTEPSNLTINTINRYLEFKARGMF